MKKLAIFLITVGVVLACSQFGRDKSGDVQNEITTTTISHAKKMPDVVDYNFHVKPILSDKCFKCHGPDKNKIEAGLSLATKEEMLKPLESNPEKYAIVAGDVEQSELLVRLHSTDPNKLMPPPESNLKLSDYEKKVLEKWIEQGAIYAEHWSFLPIERPQAPNPSGETNNYIDQFILQKLEKQDLSFSSPASKEHLIRRLAFDLTGLPPTTEELATFVNNESPTAYEELIDKYLASDAYAENMAALWMDIARYADTHGYQDDLERVMWPWRDWVIHAFKQNMPYDQFVTWQLAGDLLPNATKEQIIATAFNRNHKITQEGGVIPEEYRVEYVSDRTITFGKAFLGLTVECAKCHDHKYDPISQEDFFSLFSFFNNVPEKGLIESYGAIPEPYITISQEEIQDQLTFIQNLDSLAEIPLMVMEERKDQRQAYILERGEYDHRAEPVENKTPHKLNPFDGYDKNRLGLAKWLFDEKNPLTARVTANRIWQVFFGKGIVATADDFGAQGSLPTHPELLDYISSKLMEYDWDQQKLIKDILLSKTYKQGSHVSPELLELDPENDLLARAPRLRLTAEKIIDHVLASSDLMDKTVGGPSVKPYQPPGLWQETTGGGGGTTSKYVVDKGTKQYRRSLYTFWKRTVPPPNMMTFDAVSRDFCMVQRETTSTPLQALVMMNDPRIIEACKHLAYTMSKHNNEVDEAFVEIFERATSRTPNSDELAIIKEHYDEELSRFRDNPEQAEAFLAIGQFQIGEDDLDKAELAALTAATTLIFNLDEAISRS